MNISKPTRFTVLAHTFASLEDAVLYVNQIVNRGICQIIPLIKKIGKWESDRVLSLQTDIQRNKL